MVGHDFQGFTMRNVGLSPEVCLFHLREVKEEFTSVDHESFSVPIRKPCVSLLVGHVPKPSTKDPFNQP